MSEQANFQMAVCAECGQYVWISGNAKTNPEGRACHRSCIEAREWREKKGAKLYTESEVQAGIAAAYEAVSSDIGTVQDELLPEGECSGDNGDFCDGVCCTLNAVWRRIGALTPASALAAQAARDAEIERKVRLEEAKFICDNLDDDRPWSWLAEHIAALEKKAE